MKIINNEQDKIQLDSSIAHVNIMKELKNKNLTYINQSKKRPKELSLNTSNYINYMQSLYQI